MIDDHTASAEYRGTPHRLIRFAAALVILIYGFAKLNGSQFTILDSELDKPMGQVSGFWLTWYYFGYSPVYGSFLAVAQILGALLLTFRRTTLLAACMLAPILGNIVLIDLCYGVDPGAALVALLLLIAMLFLISRSAKKLMAVLWPPSAPAIWNWSRWAVRLAMLSFAFGLTYWVANYNNRDPTPMDGIWDMARVQPPSLTAQLPATIFFEHNRAHMVVFKARDGSYQTHHFEVDRKNATIGIWDRWLRKGDRIFTGTYTQVNSELTLAGTLRDSSPAVIHLERRRAW